MKPNLLYTLINYRIDPYIDMMNVFMESIAAFTPRPDFDVLIITDAETKRAIRERWPTSFSRAFDVRFLVVERVEDLYHALLRKFDIGRYRGVERYRKVMYLDVDIVVQRDLNDVFDSVPAKPGVVYAPAEGTVDGKYWTLDLYSPEDFERLKGERVRSFNSGTFVFVPTPDMKRHMLNVRRLGETYAGNGHFYDQSFMNYYFNMRGMSSTRYITRHVKLFPKSNRTYKRRSILHFAGIGRYNEKAGIMRAYLDKLLF